MLLKFEKNKVTAILDVSGINTSITIKFLSLIDIISPKETEFERIIGDNFDNGLSFNYKHQNLLKIILNLTDY